MASSIIEIESKLIDVDQDVHCHLMPCKIDHNGTANVNKYFMPTIQHKKPDSSIDTDHVTTSFHGRPLAGLEINLPENYIGLNIVSEHLGDNESTMWKAKQKFNKFTYWNWDKIPSANDKIQQALSWLDVAEAINGDPFTTPLPPGVEQDTKSLIGQNRPEITNE